METLQDRKDYMKKVCCYCRKEYGTPHKLPPGLPKGAVSHGICPDCVPRANAEVDALIEKNKKEQEKTYEKENS